MACRSACCGEAVQHRFLCRNRAIPRFLRQSTHTPATTTGDRVAGLSAARRRPQEIQAEELVGDVGGEQRRRLTGAVQLWRNLDHVIATEV